MARGQKQDPLPTGNETPESLAAAAAEVVTPAPAPSNGAHEGATVLPFQIKVSTPGTKGAAKPAAKVAGEDALAAMAESRGARWSVRRVSAPGYDGQPGVIGVLPLTVGEGDIDAERLAERLGAGTYEFASGEKRFTVPLATTRPPVVFGPKEQQEEYTLMSTPTGTVAVPIAKVPTQPMMFAPQPAPLVQQTDPALKATLDALMALMTKMADKRDDDAHGKFALMLEQEKAKTAKIEADARVAAAKEEAKAREAEAKAQAEARIAEAKEHARLEQLKVEQQTKAQVEIAKAQAEASKAAAEASAQAARENARIMAEAQKSANEAQLAAMKERMASEKSMTDRFLDLQEKMTRDQPSLSDQIEELQRLQSLMGGGKSEGITGAIREVGGLIENFLRGAATLRAVPPPVQRVVHEQAPAALPAPAATVTQANPAPAASAEDAQRAEIAKQQAEMKKQLMNAFATIRGASDGPADPALVAKALDQTPLVKKWLRETDTPKLLADIEDFVQKGGLSAAEKAAVEAARDAVTKNLEWFGAVIAAVRS